MVVSNMAKRWIVIVSILWLIMGFEFSVVFAEGGEQTLDEKIAACTLQIEKNPNEAEPYYVRGDAYFDKKQ
jgi:hypothetical protein